VHSALTIVGFATTGCAGAEGSLLSKIPIFYFGPCADAWLETSDAAFADPGAAAYCSPIVCCTAGFTSLNPVKFNPSVILLLL
jgi:hypothetical protein